MNVYTLFSFVQKHFLILFFLIIFPSMENNYEKKNLELFYFNLFENCFVQCTLNYLITFGFLSKFDGGNLEVVVKTLHLYQFYARYFRERKLSCYY